MVWLDAHRALLLAASATSVKIGAKIPQAPEARAAAIDWVLLELVEHSFMDGRN
eukprot:CAMPEP_0171111772 /NCGR_PEP_ID=MMETSP0766_2-20121228/76564_1 /TAXON_ID=439317 /ORGANISM="Gambierdiscus australes, Strain CAWD 149" /LENGTH=53 /DNA_ID=CAMNT_0011573811 /DNA_START=18 /DNA_END=176 /DNA_ORIENTATION=+